MRPTDLFFFPTTVWTIKCCPLWLDNSQHGQTKHKPVCFIMVQVFLQQKITSWHYIHPCLSAQLLLNQDRPEQHPNYWRQSPDLWIHLLLRPISISSGTRLPDTWAFHRHPVENHDPGLRGTDLHSGVDSNIPVMKLQPSSIIQPWALCDKNSPPRLCEQALCGPGFCDFTAYTRQWVQ